MSLEVESSRLPSFIPSELILSSLSRSCTSLVSRTLLRLLLLLLTRRPLIHPPLPQSTFDPSILLPPPASSSTPAAPPPIIISQDPVGEILLSKTLFVGSLTPGKELVRPLRSGREVMGESLWAARGLMYGELGGSVWDKKRKETGADFALRINSLDAQILQSNPPRFDLVPSSSLLISLLSLSQTLSFLPQAQPHLPSSLHPSSKSQILSRQLLTPLPPKPNPNAFPPPPTPTPTFTTVEREERARRSRAIGGFLFRGAVWEGITK